MGKWKSNAWLSIPHRLQLTKPKTLTKYSTSILISSQFFIVSRIETFQPVLEKYCSSSWMVGKVTHKPHVFGVQYCLLSSVRTALKRKCEEDVGSDPWTPLVESEILLNIYKKNTLFYLCVCVLDHVVGGEGCFSKRLYSGALIFTYLFFLEGSVVLCCTFPEQ